MPLTWIVSVWTATYSIYRSGHDILWHCGDPVGIRLETGGEDDAGQLVVGDARPLPEGMALGSAGT